MENKNNTPYLLFTTGIFTIILIIIGFIDSTYYLIVYHDLLWNNLIVTPNYVNYTTLFIVISIISFIPDKQSKWDDLFEALFMMTFSWFLGAIISTILGLVVIAFYVSLYAIYLYLNHIYDLILHLL